MQTILISLFTSTVIAAIISSLVNYRLKNLEFRNEYYKLIITKRLESYLKVERIVLMLQVVNIGDDNEKYHDAFQDMSVLNELREDVKTAIYNSIWLTKYTLDIVKRIDRLFNNLQSDFDQNHFFNDSIAAGKAYFNDFDLLKTELETACRYDLLRLHKIK